MEVQAEMSKVPCFYIQLGAVLLRQASIQHHHLLDILPEIFKCQCLNAKNAISVKIVYVHRNVFHIEFSEIFYIDKH